jgi:hypothetical protein
VRFQFSLPSTSRQQSVELRLDNLTYAAPSYYVHPDGNDGGEGRTADDPFATIQQAVLAAVPGDVILVMEGTYVSAPQQVLVQFNQAGAPDRWIVLRAHPGHQPVLRGTGWNVIFLNPAASYIEVRGLRIRGYREAITLEQAMVDGTTTEKNGRPYLGGAYFNTNGISIDGRKGDERGGKPHHLRLINNVVTDLPGGGISAIAADHVTIQGNVVRDNCHAMRYAGSGISVFRAWDFDDDRGYKMFVLGNESSGNRCYVPWIEVGRISDGNGVIIDDFINYQRGASNIPYEGRTLVQNNVVFNNGGSGIHTYAANHVDIINNTAYHNAQSPELDWRQIWAGGRCRDVRLLNNILWAQRGKPIHTGRGNSTDITYAHNLMFGDGENSRGEQGGLGTSAGAAAAEVVQLLVAAPHFVAPSVDPAVADFRLRPHSPAIDAGTMDHAAVPLIDRAGQRRPVGAAVDLGAYEFLDRPAKPPGTSFP